MESVENVVSHFSQGGIVLVVDDESRENEGDLFVPASLITHEHMKFFLKHTTGIICAAMSADIAKQLDLPPMCESNTDPHHTAFTISCDAREAGTGVSAQNRLLTVHTLAGPETQPADLRRPGHIFPLVARGGGLHERRGHTEASVTLSKLAGMREVVVLSELQDHETGKMLSGQECFDFAHQHQIPMISVEKLYQYVCERNFLLAQCDLELASGLWRLYCFDSGDPHYPHRVIVKQFEADIIPMVRIHSECFTGDVLGSLYCDCGEQLHVSLDKIANYGHGMILFPARHEGRGIGLTQKVKAYDLQRTQNLSTFEANKALGHDDDERSYEMACRILRFLKVNQVIFLSDNPHKLNALQEMGIDAVTTIPITGKGTCHSQKYLQDKKEYFERVRNDILNQLPPPLVPLEETPLVFSKKILDSVANIPPPIELANYSILICITEWHRALVENIYNLTCNELRTLGISNIEVVVAPGCWEIPLTLQTHLKNTCHDTKPCDAIICFGILIKGDTAHFEHIAVPVHSQLMSMQLKYDIPIVNAIFTCFTEEQAVRRTVGDMSCSLAKSYALTAVQQIAKK